MSVRSSVNRKVAVASKPSAADLTIKRKPKAKNFAFAKPGVVPAGQYRSEIVAAEDSKTKAGEAAVDVLYELIADSGKKFHVRMRYPLESYYFEELCEALLDAGLTEDNKISDAVSVKETVVLDYPDDSRIGSFVDRWPADGAPDASEADSGGSSEAVVDEEPDLDEDEFDNFLAEDDD